MRTVALIALCLVPLSVQAADTRPMSVDDLWNIKRLGPPSLSPDGKWVAVEVTTYDTPKDDSTSHIWLLSTDGKEQRQPTRAGEKNGNPKWSPDGKLIAFTSKRTGDDVPQIYAIDPAGDDAIKLSDMPMAPSGLKWSADGKTVYCIGWTWPDSTGDDDHVKREKEQKERKMKAVVIDEAVYRYWDKWLTDGKRPTVFAVDVATHKHRNLLAGTGKHLPPAEPSANDYDVSPDGKELCFTAESAKDPGTDFNADLYTLALDDPKAKPKNITTDNPASDSNPVYSPDGKFIAFLRQTIKFFYADRQRLMLHKSDDGTNREVAPDLDRTVHNPHWFWTGIDPAKEIARGKVPLLVFEVEDSGYIRLAALGNDGKVNYATSGHSDRSLDVIDVSKPGHSGAGFVFLRSSFDQPSDVYAVAKDDMEPRKISFFNDDIVKQWKLGKVEQTTIKGAGDEDVPMWIVYPPDFDPKKKWPLIQIVHGGPHNGISSEFSFRWNPQLWAGRGYVVGIVNFHGSSGFGQKYADSITGDYGTKPLTDILKATDWFEKQPWIDKDRTVAAGGSYGGYMVAYLNGHTDRFKAYICHAGVYNYHTQMASDVVKGRERSLGAFPWSDLEKVDKQSAQRYAGNFKTPTLILHGEKDFRVPLTHGLEYYNTLRQKGVPTRLIYFPDENHWILKPQNSKLWHKEVFNWIEKYIGSGPTK